MKQNQRNQPTSASATPDEADAALAQMCHDIEQEVKAGFLTPQEIWQGAVEMLADEYDPEGLKSLAKTLTRKALNVHLVEQKKWPDKTDCDFLDWAFMDL